MSIHTIAGGIETAVRDEILLRACGVLIARKPAMVNHSGGA
jgi:hypothetical protein